MMVACFEGSIGVVAGLFILIIGGVTERTVGIALSIGVTSIVVGILAGGIFAGSGVWDKEPRTTFGGHIGGIIGGIIGGAVGVAIGFIISGITTGIIAGGIWDGTFGDASRASVAFGGLGGFYSGYVIGCNGNCGGGEG